MYKMSLGEVKNHARHEGMPPCWAKVRGMGDAAWWESGSIKPMPAQRHTDHWPLNEIGVSQSQYDFEIDDHHLRCSNGSVSPEQCSAPTTCGPKPYP